MSFFLFFSEQDLISFQKNTDLSNISFLIGIGSKPINHTKTQEVTDRNQVFFCDFNTLKVFLLKCSFVPWWYTMILRTVPWVTWNSRKGINILNEWTANNWRYYAISRDSFKRDSFSSTSIKMKTRNHFSSLGYKLCFFQLILIRISFVTSNEIRKRFKNNYSQMYEQD